MKICVSDKKIFERNFYSQKNFIEIHLFHKHASYFTRAIVQNVFIEYVYKLLKTRKANAITLYFKNIRILNHIINSLIQPELQDFLNQNKEDYYLKSEKKNNSKLKQLN